MTRLSSQTQCGLLVPGNIDLSHRPVVRNADGTISTVRSMSFGQDGQEILIPTVAADGSRILNDSEAIAQYQRTGQFLGKFDSPANATKYAQSLHQQQARMYSSQTQSLVNAQVDSTLPPGLTPEQRDRILRYRTLRAQGLDEQTAKTLIRNAQPQAGAFMRMVGKPVLQGLGDLARMAPAQMFNPIHDPATDQLRARTEAEKHAVIDQQASALIPGAAPQGGLERFAASAVRGTTGGLAMGGNPMAGVAGASGGVAGQGAAELGAPPILQQIAALLGGLVPTGGAAMMARGRPAAEAGRMMGETLKQQEMNPPRQPLGPDVLFGPDKATAMRLVDQGKVTAAEQLGPAGQSLALRVAGEGGKGSRTILQHAKNILEDAPKRFEKMILGSVRRPNGPVVARSSVDETYQPLVNALYREARPQQVQVTPEIADLLQSSPAVRQAYRAAAKKYNVGKVKGSEQGEPIPPDFLDANGQVLPTLPVAALDEIKRGFDIVAGGKPGSAAKAAADFDAVLLPLVDQQVPVYGVARQTAREQINLREASDYVLATPEKARSMEPELGKFFDPEQMAQLKLIRDQATSSVKAAQRIASAGEPRPANGGRSVPVRRLIFEFITGMRRSLARDAATATESTTMHPDARRMLAEALVSPDLAPADALLTAAGRPGQLGQQGLMGLLPSLVGQPSRATQ